MLLRDSSRQHKQVYVQVSKQTLLSIVFIIKGQMDCRLVIHFLFIFNKFFMYYIFALISFSKKSSTVSGSTEKTSSLTLTETPGLQSPIQKAPRKSIFSESPFCSIKHCRRFRTLREPLIWHELPIQTETFTMSFLLS